jgi:hypothetical protein
MANTDGPTLITALWLRYKAVIISTGHGVLALWESRSGLAAGLALISLGAGGIKPCVAAMVGDQFEQVTSSLRLAPNPPGEGAGGALDVSRLLNKWISIE